MNNESDPDPNDWSNLTDFERQELSFAERFVEAILKGPAKSVSISEDFGQAFSVGDYMPSIVDAQHWAVEVLNASEVKPMEPYADFDLIGEIFCQCYVPYDTGEITYEEARTKGVEMAEEFFSGSEKEVMYDGSPSSPEWFALHIYRMCEAIDQKIKEESGFRKEVDNLAGDVDDYYYEKTEQGRDKERRRPYVELVNTAIKVGFLYRDAWWLTRHGDAAQRGYTAKEIGAKAGAAGGKASSERRRAYLEILIEEIENLASAVGLFSEDRILEQAIDRACQREGSFPKSKKTLDDYGTALRSEEPFKSRYEAVFQKNA